MSPLEVVHNLIVVFFLRPSRVGIAELLKSLQLNVWHPPKAGIPRHIGKAKLIAEIHSAGSVAAVPPLHPVVANTKRIDDTGRKGVFPISRKQIILILFLARIRHGAGIVEMLLTNYTGEIEAVFVA